MFKGDAGNKERLKAIKGQIEVRNPNQLYGVQKTNCAVTNNQPHCMDDEEKEVPFLKTSIPLPQGILPPHLKNDYKEVSVSLKLLEDETITLFDGRPVSFLNLLQEVYECWPNGEIKRKDPSNPFSAVKWIHSHDLKVFSPRLWGNHV